MSDVTNRVLKYEEGDEKICTCKMAPKKEKKESHKYFIGEKQDESLEVKSCQDSKNCSQTLPKENLNLQEILVNFCVDDEVLIPSEVLAQLLKIQSKYLDDHPCLCTSRFRHILHQLDAVKHKKLASLCRQLRNLTTQSSELLYETTQSYKEIVAKIFDVKPIMSTTTSRGSSPSKKLTGNLSATSDSETDEYDCDSSQELTGKLEAILARLVSDYWAIFAIEEQACILRAEESSKFDHEHRKRHEGKDECPEEIKLMKVSCADLSLKSPIPIITTVDKKGQNTKENSTNFIFEATKLESPIICPKFQQKKKDFDRKSQTDSLAHQPVLESDEQCVEFIEKYNAIFRTTNASVDSSKSPPNEIGTSDKATDNVCQHEKPRKRKERNESYDQDRKFSRSSSEILEDNVCDADSCQIKRSQSSVEVPNHFTPKGQGDQTGPTPEEDTTELKHNVPHDIRNNFRPFKQFYHSDEDSTSPTSCQNLPPMTALSSSAATAKFEKLEERRIAHPRKSKKKGTNNKNSSENNIQEIKDKTNSSKDPNQVQTESEEDVCIDDQNSCDSIISDLSTNEDNGSKPHSIVKKVLSSSLSLPVTPLCTSDVLPQVSGLPHTSKDETQTWTSQSEQQTSIPAYDQMLDQPVSWMPAAFRRESQTNEEEEFANTRAFGMLNSHKYLDPTHLLSQRRSSDPECLRRGKCKQLKRQLSNVRKKLEQLAVDFEATQGYKPSQADKQLNKNMRILMNEEVQLKRQIKSYKDSDSYGAEEMQASSPSTSSTGNADSGLSVVTEDDDSRHSSETNSLNNNNSDNSRDLEAMRNTLQDIEVQLRAKRQMKGRPIHLEEMTSDQLYSEKVDIQSALLQFEQLFGHPDSNEEKALTKDMYDRYRSVKRLVRRSNNRGSKDQKELETIPENEAISLTMASPQQRINIELSETHSAVGQDSNANDVTDESNSKCLVNNVTHKKVPNSIACEGFVKLMTTEIANNNHTCTLYNEENFHSMSRYELLQVLRKAREEKRMYRRRVKEKEEDFKKETGRRLLKEDRDHSENVYKLYKNAKAKIKLIDALLSKKVDHTFF